MSHYLSGEAADSFDREETDTETSSPAYRPPAEWDVSEDLPTDYLPADRVGYYKSHRLVTCLHSRDLDPDTDRDRPRLRCLDCGEETDDPLDLTPFAEACPSPSPPRSTDE